MPAVVDGACMYGHEWRFALMSHSSQHHISYFEKNPYISMVIVCRLTLDSSYLLRLLLES